jgi:hypothetical protein
MHVGEFAFYIRRRISGDHPDVIKGALTQAEDRGIRIQDTFLPFCFSVSVNPVKIGLMIPVACCVALRSDMSMIAVCLLEADNYLDFL